MNNAMNKIGETAYKTYCYAAKGAGKIAHCLKLKAQMASDKAQIKELYEEIGKDVYEKYVLKNEIPKDLMDNCLIIDILADEVEDIRQELLNLKNLKQCPFCHYEIGLDYHFCPNCGKEQEMPEESKANDGPATIVTTDESDANLKQKKSNSENNLDRNENYSNKENNDNNYKENDTENSDANEEDLIEDSETNEKEDIIEDSEANEEENIYDDDDE